MAEKKSGLIKIKLEELEKMVVELAKQGNTAAKIGLILRDKHGIPKAKLLGKKIQQILDEAKIEYQNEKTIVNQKLEKLEAHTKKHKHDYTSKRALTKKLWHKKRLEK